MKIRQRLANDQFADLSAPIHALAKRKGFAGSLAALVTRAPAFSTMSLGWYMHLVIPGRPVKEISPGAGPIGFNLKLGFKADTFSKFAEREGVHGVFAEFFGPKYFDKLQHCYERALSAEANRILRHLQGRLAQQLLPTDYQSVIDDLCQRIMGNRAWPPTQLILDVFNQIAIRFVGNGTPVRIYEHVIIWNTQRNDSDQQTRDFLGKLGRAATGEPPREMFDKKDGVIMLFSADGMSCGIPPLPRWKDEAALSCVKMICGDHAFSKDGYRARLRKLGVSPEKPKLIKGSFNGGALQIKWANPVRNLVKSRTEKN
jgi:hypothetical protein